MRNDALYLMDMLEAANAVGQFLLHVDRKSFDDSDLLRSAVLQKLLVVGEGAARLSEEIRAANPHVPWKLVSGFRNIAVHAYFNIQWEIVWSIATHDLPELKRQIEEILQTKFPDLKNS